MFNEKYNTKNSIRRYMRIMRQSLTLNQKYYESLKISSISLNFSYILDAQNIALFLPFDGEINTYPLILQLWLKKKVFLPVINSFYNKQLLFVHFTSDSVLYYNKYKILEPYFTSKDIISLYDLDVIIVPLVAFNRKGLRLGMGGGFYDNCLKDWKQKNFIPVGFAYDFQLINNIPNHNWDVSLPIILTPNKVWIF